MRCTSFYFPQSLCPLSELFYKGQLVTAQVWQIRQTEDMKHHVSLSLNPKVVYADWSHSAMAKKGLIINAAVKSKEEHGYVMDCGVNGLRSFLKEDKAINYCNTFNGGRPLGKLLSYVPFLTCIAFVQCGSSILQQLVSLFRVLLQRQRPHQPLLR